MPMAPLPPPEVEQLCLRRLTGGVPLPLHDTSAATHPNPSSLLGG